MFEAITIFLHKGIDAELNRRRKCCYRIKLIGRYIELLRSASPSQTLMNLPGKLVWEVTFLSHLGTLILTLAPFFQIKWQVVEKIPWSKFIYSHEENERKGHINVKLSHESVISQLLKAMSVSCVHMYVHLRGSNELVYHLIVTCNWSQDNGVIFAIILTCRPSYKRMPQSFQIRCSFKRWHQKGYAFFDRTIHRSG